MIREEIRLERLLTIWLPRFFRQSGVRLRTSTLSASMSSDFDTYGSLESTASNDQEIVWSDSCSLVRELFQRGNKGELLPSELASQILSLIQRIVAAASAEDQSNTSVPDDTPGLERMAWMLWNTVDELARENQSYHDVLIGFINAFFPLLRAQPWVLWGSSIREGNFILDAAFRESCQGADQFAFLPPAVPGATEEERKIHSWCNYCRFVARMTRDTEQEFSMYLVWFARDALEDCTWCSCCYKDAAVLAFKGVIDVCGVLMFQSDEDFCQGGAGGDGKRRWEGKSGFCKERWLFWDAGLLDIAEDKANYPAPVRDSARRTASKMQSIRAELEFST